MKASLLFATAANSFLKVLCPYHTPELILRSILRVVEALAACRAYSAEALLSSSIPRH